eukprot:2697315-Rhodomonas_salina.1
MFGNETTHSCASAQSRGISRLLVCTDPARASRSQAVANLPGQVAIKQLYCFQSVEGQGDVGSLTGTQAGGSPV